MHGLIFWEPDFSGHCCLGKLVARYLHQKEGRVHIIVLISTEKGVHFIPTPWVIFHRKFHGKGVFVKTQNNDGYVVFPLSATAGSSSRRGDDKSSATVSAACHSSPVSDPTIHELNTQRINPTIEQL